MESASVSAEIRRERREKKRDRHPVFLTEKARGRSGPLSSRKKKKKLQLFPPYRGKQDTAVSALHREKKIGGSLFRKDSKGGGTPPPASSSETGGWGRSSIFERRKDLSAAGAPEGNFPVRPDLETGVVRRKKSPISQQKRGERGRRKAL